MKQTYLKLLALTTMAITPWLINSCATYEGAPAAPVGSAAESAMPWNRPTAGLRSGYHKTSRSNIDAILNSPAPKRRPGLGTGWGTEVSSQVNYGYFQRASSKPKGVSSIYYNDSEGVKAMTGSWKYSGKGMQRAAGGLVEWGVRGSWGSLKNYNAGSRRYIVGRKGSSYSLVVKNLCHSPLEIVLSVDGLDVMDGRTASFKKRGYIVQPGKTLTVKGFRTSQSAVASFKFSSVSGSYSGQRHGTTRNVGVIGMAVFTQKGVDPWKWSRRAIQSRHGASPFAEAPASRAR